MSLQDISRDIQSKANIVKSEINDLANIEIKNLEKEYEESFTLHKEKVSQKHNSEADLVSIKLSSKFSKISKDLELDAKAQILNSVKTQALTKILDLSKTDREKVISKLFKLAKKMISYDVIFTSKADLTFVKSLTAKDIVVKAIPNLIGLVFETKDGLERLDLNFENLFNDILSDNESQIQKILFQQ